MTEALYLPYVEGMQHPEWGDVPEHTWFDVSPVQMDPDNPMDYVEHFRTWWGFGEGFAIAGHDVEVTEGALDDLHSCPGAWCWYGYANNNPAGGPHFGLVRFSADLVQAYPELGRHVYNALRPKSRRVNGWRALAGEVGNMLDTLRVVPHRHYPSVVHHHQYQ